MINWIKDNKFSIYILVVISFMVSLITIFLAIYISMGSEVKYIPIMLETDGAPAYAIFGIIITLIILTVIAQLYFGAIITHFMVKFVFRIPIQFYLFTKIYLIFTIFLSLSIIWELIVFNDIPNIFFVLANPFLILGLYILFILLKNFACVNWRKPLLFTIFCLFSFLTFTYLGG
ncbi:hypothetical protein AP3564_01085 [Aeribacillus pallidus]|uniref:Yip1 domain-containing protein n=1 Tax=Aeribacillus pallidus TaxID=33936 RepID=A0A223E1A5_9BACI|nr:hypothetical protein AP3564_01085 [Aeribacillus pallidus]